ncbi:Protein TOC75, chloroplastic [Dichanthelium oligosanthes]|uniref:Protein TOC75, chloroplastic n=1 Tax=Dichanthelium oligosanthes TaxID=888268 RepID=A0A1E5WHY9_9POAL|nr:Protein TOC75, chloroplastic [Dichanthelium oligosanthes]
MERHMREEREYQRRVRGARPCILPEAVRGKLEEAVREQGAVTGGLLRRVADRVERWYHDEGFACAQVVSFGNPSSGELACQVLEGDITKVEYQFLDKLGNVVDGNTRIPVIERELPQQQLRPGHIYNIGAGEQALKNISSLGLFSNAELNPFPDETKEGECRALTIWSHVNSVLASIKPGGTVSFGHRNISGLNRSLAGSVTSRNILNPKGDLSFNFDYEHPYLDGVENRSRNRSFKTNFFNTRKLSPVFVAGPSMEAAPPIWIDRVGFKANIIRDGLVLEEITARDGNNNICTHGSRILPGGALSMDGPPTTFSGTGVDRMALLQANMTRDNTEFVNGATIGDRCIFQVATELRIPVTVMDKHAQVSVRAEFTMDHNAGYFMGRPANAPEQQPQAAAAESKPANTQIPGDYFIGTPENHRTQETAAEPAQPTGELKRSKSFMEWYVLLS